MALQTLQRNCKLLAVRMQVILAYERCSTNLPARIRSYMPSTTRSLKKSTYAFHYVHKVSSSVVAITLKMVCNHNFKFRLSSLRKKKRFSTAFFISRAPHLDVNEATFALY